MPGKIDWVAFGLPVEPEHLSDSMLISRIERDVPTCRLDDSVSEIKRRAQNKGFDLCPVLNEHGVVLGVVTADGWNGLSTKVAGQIMELGPTTFRPSVSIQSAVESLEKNKKPAALVTSSDGKLIGVFRPSASERTSERLSQNAR